MKHKLIVIILFFSFCINAQETELDSILSMAKNMKRIQPDSALVLFNKAIVLAAQAKDHFSHANAYRQKGNLFSRIDRDSAMFCYLVALKISDDNNIVNVGLNVKLNMAQEIEKSGNFRKVDSIMNEILIDEYLQENPRFNISCLLESSNFSKKRGDNHMSLKWLNKALDFAVKQNYTQLDFFIYDRLSSLYFNMRDFDKSIYYAKLEINKLDDKDKRSYIALNRVGQSYSNLGILDSAHYYLNKVLNGKPYKKTLVYTQTGLASLALLRGNLSQSVMHADSCILLAHELKLAADECACRLSKAHALILKANFKKAKKLLQETKNCIRKYDGNNNIIGYYELLIANEIYLNGSPSLVDTFQAFVNLKDSLRYGETKKQLQELNVKYESSKKETENEILRQKQEIHQATIKKQNAYMFGGGAGFLGILITSCVLFLRNREKERHNKLLSEKNAQITSLRKEIDHRLRNQMNTVLGLIEKHKKSSPTEEAMEVLEEYEQRLYALSTLGQLLSPGNTDDKVEAEEYLKIVVDNLQFNAEPKLSSNLVVQYECTPFEISSERALLIALIITELFTNSLKHAFIEISHPNVLITLTTESRDNMNLIYQDNGNGISARHEDKGQGLGLIHEIVDQLRGDYEIPISNSGFSFHTTFPISI